MLKKFVSVPHPHPPSCVMFWDIRVPRVGTHSMGEKKQKAEEKPLNNPHGAVNMFKHLDLAWKPLMKVPARVPARVPACVPARVALMLFLCTDSRFKRGPTEINQRLC